MCWKKEAAARNWQHQKHNARRSDYSDAKSAPIWAFQPLLSWQHVQQGQSWQRWCWTQLEATRHLKATVPSIFLGLKFNGMNSKLPVQSALCQSHSKQRGATPRALFPPLPQDSLPCRTRGALWSATKPCWMVSRGQNSEQEEKGTARNHGPGEAAQPYGHGSLPTPSTLQV